MSNWGGGCCGIHAPLGAVSSFWCVHSFSFHCVHSFETDKHCRADQQLWALVKQGAINERAIHTVKLLGAVGQDTKQELKCNQHCSSDGVMNIMLVDGQN